MLFHLPVTKACLQQLILGLTLICHSSLRGVVELFGDVFHALQTVQSLVTFLENRAYAAIGITADWQRKKARLRVAAAEVARQTVRASSLVENLNSRLRNYFFLRRHLGPDYLALLQFFLNHRRFVRSERPERVGSRPPRQSLPGNSQGPRLLPKNGQN